MERAIVGFHQDDEGHWVAELECGHGRHVRHNPPWELRPWVLTVEGRAGRIGERLNCVKCDEGAPRDRPKMPQNDLVVEPMDDDRADWYDLAHQGLSRAYGDDEPDYRPDPSPPSRRATEARR